MTYRISAGRNPKKANSKHFFKQERKTMATNITEKDKTLQEVIDWCEQLEVEGLRLANALLMQRDMAAYGVVKGQIDAYEKTADHCRSMLGHSVPMYSLEQLEHERRKAWQEGYTAGWKDQECDFPQYTSENPYKEIIEIEKEGE